MNINEEEILNKFTELLSKTDPKLLIEKKNIFFKENIVPLYDKLKKIDSSLKKEFGHKLNVLKNNLETIYDKKIQLLNEQKLNSNNTNYDITISSANFTKGTLSILTIVANRIISFFKKFNFDISNGREVTEIKYNFDCLNIPQSHPGRLESECFYIAPKKKFMLRSHCTAGTIEYVARHARQDEIKTVVYGNVYRNDDDDLTHSHQFKQIDFIWIRDDLTINNIKWLIDNLLQYVFETALKTRYRLSYFPFTEPSFEVDIECQNCHGQGCSMCKNTGWIEILGAGMLNQAIFKTLQTKCKNGLAAGIGIERVAMIKYGISDIRQFYLNDFRFLKQAKNIN